MKQATALVLALALLIAPAGARPASAQQAQATLTILAGSVTHQPAAGPPGAFAPATDGMDLANGDRIRTGPDSTALVTFADGSTVTVQPDTEIAINRVGGGARPPRTAIQIILGTVWARVVRLLDPQAEFALEGQNATATVRGSEIGAQQNADGTFVCWTRSGSMTVTGFGQSLTLQPGQATTVAPSQPPTPRPFAVNASVIRATTTSPVFPLLATPPPELLAGIAAPGIVVTQVFGSYVSEEQTPRVVELPAGRPGRYTLVVEGERDADFRINLAAAYSGQPVAERQLTGRVRAGERLAADITPQLDQTTDPRTARVAALDVSELRPLPGAPSGRLVLAPAEVAAVRQRGALPRTGEPWSAPAGMWALLGLLLVALGTFARVSRRA